MKRRSESSRGERSPIGVGIIGFGFMGRAHAGAYAGLAPRCSVVGIADREPPRSEVVGNITAGSVLLDLAAITHHADAQSLLADPRVELVSICTPTDTHVDLAIAALDAGKHVLLEKPVAPTLAEAKRLAAHAARASTLCMPAMCLRFWPAWALLKAMIAERPMGALRSLAIQRLGPAPDWNDAFYLDESRSGGMIADLHIHDTDFILHALGAPTSVHTTGHARHLTTAYRFAGELASVHVTAEASWDLPSAAPFRMAYRAVFEHVMVEYDSRSNGLPILSSNTGSQPITLDESQPADGYAGEVRAIIEAIERSKPAPVSVDEAVRVMEVIEAERTSLADCAACAISGAD